MSNEVLKEAVRQDIAALDKEIEKTTSASAKMALISKRTQEQAYLDRLEQPS